MASCFCKTERGIFLPWSSPPSPLVLARNLRFKPDLPLNWYVSNFCGKFFFSLLRYIFRQRYRFLRYFLFFFLFRYLELSRFKFYHLLVWHWTEFHIVCCCCWFTGESEKPVTKDFLRYTLSRAIKNDYFTVSAQTNIYAS